MKKLTAIIAAGAVSLSLCGCGENGSFVPEEGMVKSEESGASITAVTEKVTKTSANPILSEIFCADPTAVEYDGRLYVYGTNDHQQYEAVGAEGKNTYEHIKSIVMISTDDMVNWTYHGTIAVDEVAPWIIASWAPSITSRVEEDGLTHFYLYFSNSGWGTGVITATSPTGPWSDPLGHSLIDGNTEGLQGCESPFDPGVLIDDEGTGWLSFGGGENGARIVRLGSDMISLDSEIAVIPTQNHFEASELNYINGTYVYTENNDWGSRLEWSADGKLAPPKCSMDYLTTKTPLDPESWEYKDYYFKNPGDVGMEYSNNHTHLQKYAGKWYLFYHSLFPQSTLGTTGGFRSLCVNEAFVDEENVVIEKVTANKDGVSQIKNVDAYAQNQAETAYSTSDIKYSVVDGGNIAAYTELPDGVGAYICVKGVDFADGASVFSANISGNGRVDVYIDGINGVVSSSVCCNSDGYVNMWSEMAEKVEGVHDVYFLISNGIKFDSWQFYK